MTRFLVVLIASLLAASCAAVRSNVAVSNSLPANQTAKTVAIMPFDERLGAAPDYRDYAAKLAAHLEAEGYDVVEPSAGGTADYIALFMYRIDDGTPVTRFVSRPDPVIGSIIPYDLRSTLRQATNLVYRRAVTVDLLDRARFQPNMPATIAAARVYSASATSEGSCSTMAPVIDPMLTALFADFPGESGQIRTVDIPADTACGLDRFG
jgi:hypothetical protein